MDKKICVICGKEFFENETNVLQIAYHIPYVTTYFTTNTYCKECNEKIVKPSIKEINERLKLNYKGA